MAGLRVGATSPKRSDMLNLQEERRAVAERPRRSDKLAMAVARVHYSVLLADPTVSQIEEEEHQDTDEAAKREPLMDIPTTPRQTRSRVISSAPRGMQLSVEPPGPQASTSELQHVLASVRSKGRWAVPTTMNLSPSCDVAHSVAVKKLQWQTRIRFGHFLELIFREGVSGHSLRRTSSSFSWKVGAVVAMTHDEDGDEDGNDDGDDADDDDDDDDDDDVDDDDDDDDDDDGDDADDADDDDDDDDVGGDEDHDDNNDEGEADADADAGAGAGAGAGAKAHADAVAAADADLAVAVALAVAVVVAVVVVAAW
ncbi:hypothetical protein AK812_SmicGene13030 [Symbiodinium microadriaticum]|uniref:Uncharacterized protein n=1 Tax=Symbiodinium microadriaticum TaxID=2951 RepID=A0A1Q9E952_SYMMI|nr:hypothetical protein AK812_SmicGene13030 [Symbiodinium microadriaticum]